jgi:hypothetical protein
MKDTSFIKKLKSASLPKLNRLWAYLSIGLLYLVSNSPASTQPAEPSVETQRAILNKRIERVREALNNKDSDNAEKARRMLAQWYNWGNWPNGWNNYWNNWPNWPNWYNY